MTPLIVEPSALAYSTAAPTSVSWACTPWSLNQKPPWASNTRSLGARSRWPSASVYSSSVTPVARSTRWIDPFRQPDAPDDGTFTPLVSS